MSHCPPAPLPNRPRTSPLMNRPVLTPLLIQPAEYYFTLTALRRVISRLEACRPPPSPHPHVVIQLAASDIPIPMSTMRAVDALRVSAVKHPRFPHTCFHVAPLAASMATAASAAALLFVHWINV